MIISINHGMNFNQYAGNYATSIDWYVLHLIFVEQNW